MLHFFKFTQELFFYFNDILRIRFNKIFENFKFSKNENFTKIWTEPWRKDFLLVKLFGFVPSHLNWWTNLETYCGLLHCTHLDLFHQELLRSFAYHLRWAQWVIWGYQAPWSVFHKLWQEFLCLWILSKEDSLTELIMHLLHFYLWKLLWVINYDYIDISPTYMNP